MLEKHHHIHLNKAINYIIENIIQSPNLDEVSQVSGFSKFHFHRLFKAFTGETLHQFIKRIQLEKAAFILLFDKEKSITDVALSCGFSNSQNFATAFKKHFSLTPKAYQKHKVCQGIGFHDPKMISKYDIKLIYLEEFYIEYERYFGAYYSDVFYLQQAHFLSQHSKKQYVTIFWNDPTITPKRNHCYDYGVVTQKQTNGARDTIQTIEENIYIVLTLKYSLLEEVNRMEIWSYLYTNWLPRHGYIPSRVFCFEMIDSKMIKFYIPIK